MSSEFSPTTRPVRHWGTAAAFAAIAALPPIVMLALEAGTVAQVRAIMSGVKVSSPPALLFGAEADAIAWAWTIFFAVVALIYATDTETYVSETSGTEDESEQVVANIEPDVYAKSGPIGQVEEALPVVQNLPEAQAWFKKGSELYASGRYQEAISRFDKALNLYPRLASAWAGRGLASKALGQYQEAIRCYDESLRLDPRDPAVWHDKGNALCALSRFEGALNCFNEALILDPRDARAWHNKGVCLSGLGRDDEAIACYDKALAVDPSYALAWHAKGMADERLGRIQDAVGAYKQFITLASARGEASLEKFERHVHELEASLQAGTQAG